MLWRCLDTRSLTISTTCTQLLRWAHSATTEEKKTSANHTQVDEGFFFFVCVFLFNFLVLFNVFYFVFGVKLKIEKDKTQQETNGKTCAYCRRSAARLILAPASPPTLTTRCCVCVRRGPLFFFSLSLSLKLHGDKLCSSALWRIHTYPPSTDQSCFVFLLNSLSPSSLPIFRDRYSQFDGHTIKSLSAFFYLAICCLIKFICVFFFF